MKPVKTEKLSSADQELLAAHYSRMKRSFRVILIAQAVTVTGVGAAMALTGVQYWYYIIAVFVLTDVIALSIICRRSAKARRDLEERSKVSGTFRITRKSRSKSIYYFTIDANGARRVQVDRKVYNRVSEGDELHIEFGRHSGVVLVVKQGDDVIYHGISSQGKDAARPG
jgi:uncharacterized membrane protein